MLGESDENELIRRAASGCATALKELLQAHQAKLRRRVEQIIPSDLRRIIDAEDLVQQAFSRAFLHLKTYDETSPGSFYAWLRQIAENQLRNEIRALKARKRIPPQRMVTRRERDPSSSLVDFVESLSAHTATPSQRARDREAVEALEAGIAELSSEQRQAVQLCCLDGLKVEEAAQRMCRTPGAVRGLVYRAKRRLRELLVASSRWLGS